jgi:hypothetical protein
VNLDWTEETDLHGCKIPGTSAGMRLPGWGDSHLLRSNRRTRNQIKSTISGIDNAASFAASPGWLRLLPGR